MGCGGSCGGGGCGGNCSCGGNCGCKTETVQEAHPHRFCITCGEERDGPDALFDHNQKNHNLPEPNHCPVCGIAITEQVDGDQKARRLWMKRHIADGDEDHRQYLQLQPF